MSFSNNIFGREKPFHFMNLPEKKILITFTFKVEGIYFEKQKQFKSQTLTYSNFQGYVNQKEKQKILGISLGRPILRFVKNKNQFIPFHKLEHEYKSLLKGQKIQVQYLYKNKRDQLQRKLGNFQSKITEKHALLKEISQQQRSRIDLIKKLASNYAGLQSQVNLQVKIRIVLYVSDPLVRNKTTAINNEEINFQDHIKILKQASSFHQSVSIFVERAYALSDQKGINLTSVLMEDQSHRDSKNIIHFFTNVVRKDGQLYIVFEGKKKSFGQQKLVNAKQFFQNIKNLPISLLILMGSTANLLNEVIPGDFPFSILLLSTYSSNRQQSFKFFIQTFYEHLFNRNQINKSVQMAKTQYEKKYVKKEPWKNNRVCCCLHEHKQNCAWTKITELVGKKLAHKMFLHSALKARSARENIWYLQSKMLEYFSIQAELCGDLQKFCCLQNHQAIKDQIMKTKIIFLPKSASPIFIDPQNSIDLKKNAFNNKLIYQKISQCRRRPLILYQIVKKILDNKNKIIQFIGSRRSGKTQFLESACKYIQNRKRNYQFQNVDDNQGSLKECARKMFSVAEKLKKDKKAVVFIHHNTGMIIEKQNIMQFNLNTKDKLPFTFLIKINSQQQEKIQSSFQNQTIVNKPIIITLPKLNRLEIFCQIYHQIKHKSFFQDNNNLMQIINFCDKNNQILNYRILRNFLKDFGKDNRVSWNQKNKTLIDVFDSIQTNFFRKMQFLKQKNKKLFDFLAFLSLFPEGIYLTKLTMTLLRETFNISDIHNMIRNNENLNYYFQVLPKFVNFKTIIPKIFKADFILPDQKVIKYFRRQGEYQFICQEIKLKYFRSFFNLIEAFIFQYMDIIRKKNRKEKIFLEEGIFMFNRWKSHKNLNLSEKQKNIYSTMKRIQNQYQNQMDDKISDLLDMKNKVITSLKDKNSKEKIVHQKTLSFILQQSQIFVLNRHIPTIASLISPHLQEENIFEKSRQSKINQTKRKCPVIFYRKIMLVCKILLREPYKYEIIETKLRNLEPKYQNFFKIKGSKLIEKIIESNRSKKLDSKSYRSFHELHEKNQNSSIQQGNQVHYTFESYIVKLINFLQMKVMMDRKQFYSLYYGDNWGKRKSLKQTSLNNQRMQKSNYLKRLENILPKMQKQVKSQNLIQNPTTYFSHTTHKNLLSQKNKNQLKDLTTEELLVKILEFLLIYESEEQFINYFHDQELILQAINNQIESFKFISDIQHSIDYKSQRQEIKQKYWFIQSVCKEEISMQILRLCMRKIQIHFKLKKSQKDKTKQNIKRLIDLKNQLDLQQHTEILKQSFNDPRSFYYKNQRIAYYLKNSQICSKYIHFILKNQQVTQEFKTSIGQVDSDFSQILSYLCEQSMKKTLFNEQNNIVFFKSRVIAYDDKPYTYVRKRNVTMKYMLKTLKDFKISITFLHLTKNNFTYIQKDIKQNPNCIIKYLVLTVDTVQQKNQLVLIFEHQKNITHESVKLSQFLTMMDEVTVEFIIVMGRRAILLAEHLSSSVKGNPIVIGIESPKYGLDNFVQYLDPTFINDIEEDEAKIVRDQNSQQKFTQRIEQYMNLESFHCISDMIVCSLVTDLVHLPHKKPVFQRHSSNSFSRIVCNYSKIEEILKKSGKLAKQIMTFKWDKAKQIQIDFGIFHNDTESQSNLKKNFSILSASESIETQLTQRISSRQSNESIKCFPYFQKGFIVDNTVKLYESHMQSQEYYENVNRNQHLFTVMSFMQQPGRRIVQILGSPNAGKTCFLKQICWMNFIYRSFKDGVYFIDLINLSKSSQTVLQHIEIFYKQSKLFSLLESDEPFDKSQPSTILLALDNLDSNSIRQNQYFFDKLKGKPICLLYSTRHVNLQKELQKYLKISIFDQAKFSFNRSEDSDLLYRNFFLGMKPKNIQEKRSLISSSSMELQSKKSSEISQTTLQTQEEQKWAYLKLDINILSKNALFNIALSYLKKEELKTLKVGMYDFIKNNFSAFITQVIQDICSQNPGDLPQSLNQLDHKKYSQSNMNVQYKGLPSFQRASSSQSLVIERTKSLMQGGGNSLNQSTFNIDQAEFIGRQMKSSNVAKLMKLMDEYFQNLSDQKVLDLGLPAQKQGEVNQKVPLIQKLDENILHSKKDSRLWFYQNCFEQLMIKINAYDLLEVVFQ